MNIRLIAMDLDGTSLQRDHCSFSPRLLETLAEVHQKGVRIVPVTGRQFGLLPPVLQQPLPWLDYAVLCNGGQIRSIRDNRLLHNLEMDGQALAQLLDLADKYHLAIEFSKDSVLYLTQTSHDLQLPWPNLTFHRDAILAHYSRILPSLRPLCGPGVEKVNLICIQPEVAEQVEQELKSIGVSAVWASGSSMEITHPDATKGNGLAQLCRLLGISTAEVMAIGDSGNDIPMLKLAGLGVAMGNAPDFVKAAADLCALPYDEDGAAYAIEQHIL